MRNILPYKLLEHKFWGKSISDFLYWFKLKSENYFVIIDTETTGLPNDTYEVQLTQISCLVIKYNYTSNSFNEIDKYNKKLKLTPETLSLSKNKTRIPKVLSFNHYGQKDIKYFDEKDTLKDFYNFLNKYDNSILIIQNAEFDMRYLNIRSLNKFDNEVIDTKQILQLFYLPLIQKLSENDINYTNLIKKIGTSDRDNGLISSSMGKIGPALGINMSGYHDALTDCRITAEMLQKIIQFLKDNQNIDIKKYQYQRINTKK